MKSVIRLSITAWLAASLLSAATLNLMPPDLTGLPGQTVGWGFEFNNDTPFFAVLASSEFTPPPALGVYVDFLSLSDNFAVVAPNSTLTEAFSYIPSGMPGQTVETGLGLFAINAGAQIGQGSAGTLIVSYDLYMTDPNGMTFDPSTDAIAFGNTISTGASVTATPEPSSTLPVGAGLCALGWAARLLRRLALPADKKRLDLKSTLSRSVDS